MGTSHYLFYLDTVNLMREISEGEGAWKSMTETCFKGFYGGRRRRRRRLRTTALT
jgi:hypothetical protein